MNSLREHSAQPDYTFDRLYRNLYNPDFLFAAYQNIYAAKGNMTAGVDGQTIDAMSQERIARLIEQLKGEQYHPYPARRTYIPKKNGKLRPLGVPSIDEKLVLEAARMILEAIYDDSFEDTSHGFRPGRICHTALRQIQNRLMLLASFPPPLPICSAFSLFPSPALPQHTVDAASHNIPCTPLCFVPDTFYETTGA